MASVRALVIAGGGAGTAAVGGLGGPGGGAGGVIHETSFQLNAGTYAVTVGAGGVQSAGENSILSTLVAIGGGYNGGSGGSGSGARAPLNIGTVLGGAGTLGQGYSGAQGSTFSNPSPPPVNFYSTGQGGSPAGESGLNHHIGIANDITGTTVNYAGGGEPGVITSQNSTGGGGPGGGGVSSLNGGGNGAANKGAGGGGGSTGAGVTSGAGGNGGSGVVIIRYLTTDYQSGSGGNVTIDGLYTVRTFTSSDTLTLVGNPGIDARDESFTSNWGNTDIGNAFTNDLLNDGSFSPGDVITTIVTPATPVSGNPVPVLNTTTGVISIPDYTYPGVYTIVYQICDALNPATCDQATITITVTSPTVTANNILFVNRDGTSGNANIGNALSNDTINGIAVVPARFTITVITPAVAISGGSIPVINTTTGVVSSPVGTNGGTYTIVYQICETNNLANCSQATITLQIEDIFTKIVKTLVVAGGGGGGSTYGTAGGGAGGVLYNDSFQLRLGTYIVTVGAGGNGVLNNALNKGGNSSFSTITATGGGGGRDSDGSSGGSGSGGGAYGYAGGQGIAGQGFRGGTGRYGSGSTGSGNPYVGGGGGGAGAVGQDGQATGGGNGGVGVQNSISGVATYYGGGGGAGADNVRRVGAGTGGLGGGGNGGDSGQVVASPTFTIGGSGTPNTGGGGGGSNNTATTTGGLGGSGIVIIRYTTGALIGTGGTITTDGPDTIHTFTSTGIFVAAAPVAYVEYALIGGGGGGGFASGGGGGGGGYVQDVGLVTSGVTYPIVVGNGGAAGISANPTSGGDGGASTFNGVSAAGGGGGGGGAFGGSPLSGASGRAGGSGGGAATYGGGNDNNGNVTATGGAGNTPARTPIQGYAGAGTPQTFNRGSGGGGAGAVGVISSGGGTGGIGVDNIFTGSLVKYCGGGAGGRLQGYSATVGGLGGGGAGGIGAIGTSGTTNTGGGGGGGGLSNTPSGFNGGAGGSGIVMIRYLTSAFGVCTGGTITTVGDYTVHTFTSNGNFVPNFSSGSTANFLFLMS